MSAAEKKKSPGIAGQGFGVNHLEAIHMADTTAVQANAQQLVRVFDGVIGGVPAQVVDGRELHTFLKAGWQFSDWIKKRIEHYGFEENQDFSIVSVKTETIRKYSTGDRKGASKSIDYHLTLDMAKELSMVENNEQGRMARRYFIDMERKALSASALPAPSEQQAQSVEQAAFRGRTVLVAYYGGQPWFSAGNLCTALGLGGSDRIIRSLPTQMKRRMQRGSRELWMVNAVGAARAADYCKAELAEDYLAWLRRVVGQQPAPAEPTDAGSLLRAMLAGNRFLCHLDDMGRITLREIPESTLLINAENLPQWISDPYGPPAKLLPDILEAVSRRMKTLH